MSSSDNPRLDPPSTIIESTPVPFPADPFSPAPLAPPPSTENPVWTGWDVLLIAVFIVLLAFLIVPVLIVSGARFYAYPRESWLEVARKPALALLSQFIAYVIVALFMILRVEGKYHTRFWKAISWNWPGMAGVNFIGLGVVMLGLDLLGRFLPLPKNPPFDQFFARPSDAYLTAIFAVTLGPLMEELFFRGFLYPTIARRMGVLWGILLTSLPFGLIHFIQYGNSWGAVLIVFLVGVVLTAVRARTKSVASSFLAHVGYNGTVMVIAAWATDGFRHMEKAGVLLGYLGI